MMLAQIFDNPEGFMDWKTLLLAFFAVMEAVVRLTPSEKDNSIVSKIVTIGTSLLNFILPNRRKGGGKFKIASTEQDKANESA
jgi:hypothetical protein